MDGGEGVRLTFPLEIAMRWHSNPRLDPRLISVINGQTCTIDFPREMCLTMLWTMASVPK